MRVIDSHHHLWQYNEVDFPWIDDSMKILKKDFLPYDYQLSMKENNLVGSVVIQARQSEDETKWLLDQSKSFDFILGVVGWIDLKSSSLEEKLIDYKSYSKLKGFRHVIHDEPDIDFMLNSKFIEGVKLLGKYDYSYDVLIKTQHLDNTISFLNQLPEMKIVIDHIAKPDIKKHEWDIWVTKMKYISERFPHVFCKLSGAVTEADWDDWDDETIQLYLKKVISIFGVKRVMFGSDWPVCQIAAPLNKVFDLCVNSIPNNDVSNVDDIFYNNVKGFYQL